MPKIDPAAVPALSGSTYPEPHASRMGRRTFQRLGDAAGLTRFGAVLVTLFPGDTSSLRHWHSAEDEFVWVVEGELVLVQDAGETALRAGDAAGFPAGDPDGHQLLNRSDAPARYLVVGTRAADDVCTYSDVDLVLRDGRFTRRDGTPVEAEAAHPLRALHARCQQDGRLTARLLDNPKAGVVRLSIDSHGLWAMLAREDGSIWDRWASDGDARFLRFTDSEAARGSEVMFERLLAEAGLTRAGDEKETP